MGCVSRLCGEWSTSRCYPPNDPTSMCVVQEYAVSVQEDAIVVAQEYSTYCAGMLCFLTGICPSCILSTRRLLSLGRHCTRFAYASVG